MDHNKVEELGVNVEDNKKEVSNKVIVFSLLTQQELNFLLSINSEILDSDDFKAFW